MTLKDITNKEATTYTLNENEQCVFFMFNKSGNLTFELAGPHAEAHIFTLFIGQEDTYELSLTQKHLASRTTSQALIHSVLGDNASVEYLGLIHIANNGAGSAASQESRALLLSQTARHSAIPSLEILPRDVTCHHKASASPLNSESLYYLQSRGLNREESSRMLVNGFLETLFTQIAELGVHPDELQNIREVILQKIMTLSYA